VAALVLPHAEDPVSVTIVPRGEAGGVTWMGGSDHSFVTRSEAEARLTVAMAGRAAEEIHLGGDFTQGAASDFASATNLAHAMVTEYGMSELGVTCRSTLLHHHGSQPERVAAAVDALLERAMARAREVVAAHGGLVEAVARELLAEETVSGATMLALARRQPLQPPAMEDCLV
jgi:cell division protease FtsH